jgi:uncharacterized membrane protein YqjE
MEDNDIVDKQSVGRVRAITKRTALRVVLLSVLVGLGAGLLMALVVYAVYGAERVASTALAVFPVIGLYQAVHWLRHYRCIFRQLDALEARVANGEVVYGSQVEFRSYR